MPSNCVGTQGETRGKTVAERGTGSVSTGAGLRERGLRPVQVSRDATPRGGQAAKTTEPATRPRGHQRDDISRRGSDDKQSGGCNVQWFTGNSGYSIPA